jgi:hypothetical protein
MESPRAAALPIIQHLAKPQSPMTAATGLFASQLALVDELDEGWSTDAEHASGLLCSQLLLYWRDSDSTLRKRQSTSYGGGGGI